MFSLGVFSVESSGAFKLVVGGLLLGSALFGAAAVGLVPMVSEAVWFCLVLRVAGTLRASLGQVSQAPLLPRRCFLGG